ncbi:MAG: hypothetical protein KDE28_29645 [Anaerolineales bacterium]|nr:hypothetical protein [Anaerolineales bacterium]MCB0032124.1 hypothetical protein [Anaerolineales bacterium]
MSEKGSSSVGDMFEKITDEQTFLGKIASKIPGFSGYREREQRRDADQLMRNAIARDIDDLRLSLGNIQLDLNRDIMKSIEHADSLGTVDTRLMGLAKKLRAAPVGYAGLFDPIKIKEEELAEIYNFDNSMLNYVSAAAKQLSALEAAVAEDGDIAGSIRALDLTLRDANETFNQRQDLLSGTAG